jgi:DNA primase
MPLSEYLIEELSQQVDMRSLDGRARLAELVRPLVAKVPEGIFRQLLIERLGQAVQLGGEKLSKLIGKPTPAPAVVKRKPTRASGMPSPVRVALALLLRRPALAERVTSTLGWETVPLPGADLLVRVLEQLREAPGITTAGLLERWRDDPEGRHLHRLFEREDPVPDTGVESEFDDTVRRLDALAQEARLEVLLAEAGAGTLDEAGKQELRRLLGTRGPAAANGSILDG